MTTLTSFVIADYRVFNSAIYITDRKIMLLSEMSSEEIMGFYQYIRWKELMFLYEMSSQEINRIILCSIKENFQLQHILRNMIFVVIDHAVLTQQYSNCQFSQHVSCLLILLVTAEDTYSSLLTYTTVSNTNLMVLTGKKYIYHIILSIPPPGLRKLACIVYLTKKIINP